MIMQLGIGLCITVYGNLVMMLAMGAHVFVDVHSHVHRQTHTHVFLDVCM